MRQTGGVGGPASGSGRLDDAEIARLLDLGHENARIMELAADHCRHLRYVEFGGRGMLEAASRLPLNTRRVECPVAIGNVSGMRLDDVTFGFYAEHCVGCNMRDPTGRLPNLESEALARQAWAHAEEADRVEKLRVRRLARTARVERRGACGRRQIRRLRASWTTSMFSTWTQRLRSTGTRPPRRGAG